MSRIFSVVPSGRAAARPALIAAMLVALSATAPVAAAQDTTAAAKTGPAAVTTAAAVIVPAAPVLRTDTATRAPSSSAPRTSVPAAATSTTQLVPVKPAAAAVTSPTVTPPVAEAPADDLANPYVQRAVSLYELGKDDAALAEYRRGIAADPLDSDTWYGLADLLHELGRDKQAIETYTLALSTIEHAPELRLPFAELLMANQKKADAIKVLQRGIEIDPTASADLKDMLGKVLYGVLGDSAVAATPAAVAPAADSLKKAPVRKTKPKTVRKKKKLCNLFCPGSLDAVAPKP